MNIIVTGASSGIGFQLVKTFAKDNHHIVAIARNQKKLELLQAQCLKETPSSHVNILDYDLALLKNEESKSKLYAKILEIFPHVDILINNAAILINKPFLGLNSNDFLETFNTNVFSIVSLVQLFLSHMGKERPSHIVNISSMGGIQGSSKYPGLSAYSSSKAALNCLTECMAVELSPLNIKVNSLALGAVQTEMLAKAFPDYNAPLNAEEMACFIAQFSLTGHHYFNGKIIPVSCSTP